MSKSKSKAAKAKVVKPVLPLMVVSEPVEGWAWRFLDVGVVVFTEPFSKYGKQSVLIVPADGTYKVTRVARGRGN